MERNPDAMRAMGVCPVCGNKPCTCAPDVLLSQSENYVDAQKQFGDEILQARGVRGWQDILLDLKKSGKDDEAINRISAFAKERGLTKLEKAIMNFDSEMEMEVDKELGDADTETVQAAYRTMLAELRQVPLDLALAERQLAELNEKLKKDPDEGMYYDKQLEIVNELKEKAVALEKKRAIISTRFEYDVEGIDEETR